MDTTQNEPEEYEYGVKLPPPSLEIDQYYADHGRGFAQMRMARRYRDGDGVEKDLFKARLHFTKAIAAGMPGASDELEKLPAAPAQYHNQNKKPL